MGVLLDPCPPVKSAPGPRRDSQQGGLSGDKSPGLQAAWGRNAQTLLRTILGTGGPGRPLPVAEVPSAPVHGPLLLPNPHASTPGEVLLGNLGGLWVAVATGPRGAPKGRATRHLCPLRPQAAPLLLPGPGFLDPSLFLVSS